MKWRLLRTPIEREDDVVTVRQRARFMAERLGLSRQVQTGLATAVSEIARNAYGYAGGGIADFGIRDDAGDQFLVVSISDKGPGIGNLATILDGRYVSQTGMGLGIVGARRLVDEFDIRSEPGQGSVVTLAKRLPDGRRLSGPDVTTLAEDLVRERDANPQEAVRAQNRDLVQSLADLAEKEEETRQLNAALREAHDTLERRVAERTAELAAANTRLSQEAVERERIKDALRQAQKMEAVGQLTGGIAHDFNNLLTGIVGSLDLLQRRFAQGRTERIERYIETAMSSANRAAVLTHRLLAFSRPQPLAPKPTDANTVIRGMEELLRRTITDAIAFRVSAALDLWPVLCDAHELENAILNLCINARDAMPDGGTLAIETANEHLDANYVAGHPTAAGGDHVSIRIVDNGTGMPPDVVERVFEPFFTTKPVGKGTGLGMAMIYGFTRQSGGHCRIDTQVGRGTAIYLYLPRHVPMLEASDPAAEAWRHTASVAASTAGAVLVIEQNATVRDLMVEILAEDGHRVHFAEDGEGAMRILTVGERVDLLVTDIGLPGGMTGRRLAELAREAFPKLLILFITGSAGEGYRPSETDLAGVDVLPKPFQAQALADRVRTMLQGDSISTGSS